MFSLTSFAALELVLKFLGYVRFTLGRELTERRLLPRLFTLKSANVASSSIFWMVKQNGG